MADSAEPVVHRLSPDLGADAGAHEPFAVVEDLVGLIESLKNKIELAYTELEQSDKLTSETVSSCLAQLRDVELKLRSPGVQLQNIIEVRGALVRVANETRATLQANDERFALRTAMVVYALVLSLSVVVGVLYGAFNKWTFDGLGLNRTFIGLPAYVWIWSAIGSGTAMLLRAGKLTRENRLTVSRWLLYRPVVGISTGVLMYLVLRAGLIIITQADAKPRVELLYVLSYLGGLSDTLSINLLQRVMGHVNASPAESPMSDWEARLTRQD